MDPAIAEYIETPRQLHTDDLLPPFLNPSGSVKAAAVPRGSRARGKAAEGSGGEGGSTHTTPGGSTPGTAPEVSTSQILPQKRASHPQDEARKVGKTLAGSTAGGASKGSSEAEAISLLSESEGEEGRGTTEPEKPSGEEQPTSTLPTDGRPFLWYPNVGAAAIRRFHQRPTQAMGGKLSNFPLQVGDAVRSRNDLVVRHAWPRDEVAHRVMEHGLDCYNSLYYMCQLRSVAEKEVVGLTEENKKLIAENKRLSEKVQSVDNLRLAMGSRADSLEKDVTRLSTSVTSLTADLDKSRGEVEALRAKLETETARAKEHAETAARGEIDLMKARIDSLRSKLSDRDGALVVAGEKVKALEEATDRDGKELVDLRRKLGNPLALRRLYQDTDEHAEEMEHYLSEGFKMTTEYMLRDVVKEGRSSEEVRRIIEELDYDTVKDADVAFREAEEDAEEGENST